MKKTYQAPEMQMVQTALETMIAQSIGTGTYDGQDPQTKELNDFDDFVSDVSVIANF